MKLVHVISGLNTGGAEMMLFKLLSVWDRSAYQVEVISLTDVGVVGDRIRGLNIPVRALDMPRGRPSLTGLFRLARWLRQSSPDVIQTWMYHADLIGGLASKLGGGAPVVWGIRNGLLERRSNKRSTIWTAKLCARLSSSIPKRIAVNSENARRFHETMGYNAEKMAVIPNGFDLTAFKPDAEARRALRSELGLPTETLLIGLVARFDPQKDHRNFIEAARLLIQRIPDARFVLCGDGVDAGNGELNAWIRAVGLVDRVHLLGRRDDIAKVTAALDVACCSSYAEAFPNVVGEAMACAVPCVVTDVGDSAFIVGDAGKVVPPQQPERLAEAMSWMIALGAEGRQQLGGKARRRIEENFDLSVIRDRYAALYREVAAKRA
jgi:glycosyltransferase involved in cell wall biosynthesis